jgi:hypothetical protein
MSDDEGYAPAAQMLICFIFPACVQKNTDADDRCHPQPSRTLALVSLAVRSVPCRRRTMRLLASADVWVYWECDRLRDISHVRDLSMAGLFIETRRSRPKSDLLHVHFLVAEGSTVPT